MTTVRVVLCMFRAVSNMSILSCHTCIHVIVCFTGSIKVVTLSNFVGNYSLLTSLALLRLSRCSAMWCACTTCSVTNAEARAHSAFVDAKFAGLRTMLASRKGVRDEELAKTKVCTVPVNTGACDSIFVVMVTFNYTARFMVASVLVASLCSRLPVSGCRTSSRRYSAA